MNYFIESEAGSLFRSGVEVNKMWPHKGMFSEIGNLQLRI